MNAIADTRELGVLESARNAGPGQKKTPAPNMNSAVKTQLRTITGHSSDGWPLNPEHASVLDDRVGADRTIFLDHAIMPDANPGADFHIVVRDDRRGSDLRGRVDAGRKAPRKAIVLVDRLVVNPGEQLLWLPAAHDPLSGIQALTGQFGLGDQRPDIRVSKSLDQIPALGG